MAAAQEPVAFDLFQIDPKREKLSAERARELGAPLLELARKGPVASLRLAGKSFGKEAALAFAEILAEVKGVTCADFSDIISGQETLEALEVLEILTEPFQQWKLEELNLSDNALGYKGSCAISKGLSSQSELKRLYVRNDGLQAPAAEVLTDLLLSCQPDKTTKLEVFETWNNLLESAGAVQFSRLFKASPNLVHLRFASTRVLGDGGKAIVEALEGRENLEFLDLSDNCYGPETGEVIAESLLKSQPNLRTLKIGDMGFDMNIYKVLESLTNTAPNLEVLDLQCCEIDADNASTLAKLLASKPGLKTLNLHCNELEDKGLAVIAYALRNHKDLTTIDLTENQLSSASVESIKKYLLTLPSLEELRLNSNGFSAEALEDLEAAFKDANLDMDEMVGSMSDNDEDFEPDEEYQAPDVAELDKLFEGLKI